MPCRFSLRSRVHDCSFPPPLSFEPLGVFARMPVNVDTSNLVGGVWLSLPLLYLLCGLFSDARWLQPKWGRRFVVPLSRLSRVFFMLLIGFFAVGSFTSAFHYDVHFPSGLAFPTFLIVFVLFVLTNIRDHRLYKSKHDPDA